MKFVLLSVFVCLISSCVFINDETILGYYSPLSYTKNYDTLIVLKGGIYKRVVYDKNKRLLLNMTGKWSLQGDAIYFDSFYFNLDDDLVKFPYLVNDTSGGWVGILESDRGKIKFCVGHYAAKLPNQNCYTMIK